MLAEETGEDGDFGQGFTMYLGCNKTIGGVILKNTHNAIHRDRSAKKFRLLGSVNLEGPWDDLLVANLTDSREQTLLPLQHLAFSVPVEASFVKFELLESWGNGGGLQFFKVI